MSNVRIPLQSLVVERDGEKVIPEVGKPFEFEDDELEQMPEGAVSTEGVVAVDKPLAVKGGKPAAKKAAAKTAKPDDGEEV